MSGCFPKCTAEECFPSHRKEYNMWFLWNYILTSFLWWRIWRVCVTSLFHGWHFLVIKYWTPTIPGKNSNNLWVLKIYLYYLFQFWVSNFLYSFYTNSHISIFTSICLTSEFSFILIKLSRLIWHVELL